MQYTSVPAVDVLGFSATATVQASDGTWVYTDIAFESLCDISKTDLVACICEQQLSDAVHRKSEEDAKALTYQLAMEHDMYIMPADWSTASSAWCKCTGLPQRIGPVDRWCEHAAAIIYQLADICDDDPFFVYQMRGLHLAAQLRACRGVKHPRVEVDLCEPCGTSS